MWNKLVGFIANWKNLTLGSVLYIAIKLNLYTEMEFIIYNNYRFIIGLIVNSNLVLQMLNTISSMRWTWVRNKTIPRYAIFKSGIWRSLGIAGKQLHSSSKTYSNNIDSCSYSKHSVHIYTEVFTLFKCCIYCGFEEKMFNRLHLTFQFVNILIKLINYHSFDLYCIQIEPNALTFLLSFLLLPFHTNNKYFYLQL